MTLDVEQQVGETSMVKGEHAKSFDTIGVKFINCDSVKPIIFTKLQSTKSQRQTKIAYKIGSEAGGNLMPFRIFKCLFSKSTIESLHEKIAEKF